MMSLQKHSPNTLRFTSDEAVPAVQVRVPLSSRSVMDIVSPNREGIPLVAAGDPLKTGREVEPTQGMRILPPSETEREGGGARIILS